MHLCEHVSAAQPKIDACRDFQTCSQAPRQDWGFGLSEVRSLSSLLYSLGASPDGFGRAGSVGSGGGGGGGRGGGGGDSRGLAARRRRRPYKAYPCSSDCCARLLVAPPEQDCVSPDVPKTAREHILPPSTRRRHWYRLFHQRWRAFNAMCFTSAKYHMSEKDHVPGRTQIGGTLDWARKLVSMRNALDALRVFPMVQLK